ncbi:MAG TPA: rhomboid family intramembrane serine protease [Acidimicrobiaceae bacterium]|nr:rhomboid family intramembrane serine protease [Acidimicrobiaceae bacterium]
MSLPLPPTLPTCYRHPGREAGRSCTRCGKPACSECLVQATVGSHCLDCAKAARPDLKTRVKYANARVLTPVTYALVGINIAVFLWMVLLDTDTLSNRMTEAHVDLGLNRSIVHYTDEWYRIITSGFIHFGIIHLGFNMFILYQLGQLVERELGTAKMLLCYFASLLGGSFGVLLLDGADLSITGGASGAVFGMMGVAAVGMHRRGVNIFNTGLGSTLLLNLVITFTMRNISIGGHIGGLVAGAICGWFVLAPGWKPVPAWARWATPLAVGGVAALGCLWAVSSLPVFVG